MKTTSTSPMSTMSDPGVTPTETYLDTNVLLKVLEKKTADNLRDDRRDTLVACWTSAAELSTFVVKSVRHAMQGGKGGSQAEALARAAREILDHIGLDGTTRPNGIPVELRTVSPAAAAFVLAVAGSPMLAYAVPEPTARDRNRDYFRRWATKKDLLGTADMIITGWASYTGGHNGGLAELLSRDSGCRELASRIGFSATEGEPLLRAHCTCTEDGCPNPDHLRWKELAGKHGKWSALTRDPADLKHSRSAVLFTHSAFDAMATGGTRGRAVTQEMLDRIGDGGHTLVGLSTALMLQQSAIDRHNYIAWLKRKNGGRKSRNSPPVDPADHRNALRDADARSREYRSRVLQLLQGVFPLPDDRGRPVVTANSIVVPDVDTMKELVHLRNPLNNQLSLRGKHLHPPLHEHEETAILNVLSSQGCDVLVVAAGEQADRLTAGGQRVSRL